MEIASSHGLSNSSAAQTQPALSSDFETFLKMLTAQMRNQDPLNPIESSDYATQLATFSSVEQQVLTNDLLKAVQTQIGAMGMSQLAGWVGMEAKVLAPAEYSGQPIELVPYPHTSADQAELVIKDASGAEIRRMTIPTKSEPMSWDGTNEFGNSVPHGQYEFTVESFSDGSLIESLGAEVYARINEARTTSDGVYLVLSGGAVVHSQNVTGLRQAA